MGGGFLIQVAPQVRILVAVEAVDGRKGIDAIAQLCREKLNADPFSGYLFIFRTRSGTAIRILQYDGQGFWLATKRCPDAAGASGAVAAGGRKPRCGSSARMAATERLKKF